jgi:AP-1 complex subunit sigma 1/2
MLINRQGKIRLIKWYESSNIPNRLKYIKDVAITVIGRSSRLCNFLEWGEYKIVYKRYASLYFITLVDKDDNELIILEMIHHFVECLDRYFGSVCELDIIFNYHKAYYIVEEILAAGFIQESDKKSIIKNLQLQDSQLHEEKEIEYNTNNK